MGQIIILNQGINWNVVKHALRVTIGKTKFAEFYPLSHAKVRLY